MTISLEEMKKSLSPDRLAKIGAKALELEAERAAFLRADRAWELTLKQLAEERGADPATIEGEAQRTDVILNTLKNFIAAAGGELRLVVEFPDDPTIEIERLADLNGDDDWT